MIDEVLERLEALRARLAAIDPAREIDAADRVASIAIALRAVVADKAGAAPRTTGVQSPGKRAAG